MGRTRSEKTKPDYLEFQFKKKDIAGLTAMTTFGGVMGYQLGVAVETLYRTSVNGGSNALSFFFGLPYIGDYAEGIFENLFGNLSSEATTLAESWPSVTFNSALIAGGSIAGAAIYLVFKETYRYLYNDHMASKKKKLEDILE